MAVQVNTAGWAQAGRSIADSYASIADTTRKYSPRYDEMAQVGIKARSKEKQAAITAERYAREAEIKAETTLKGAEIAVDQFKAEQGAKKTQRKAGMIAAAGQAIGVAVQPSIKPPKPEQYDFSKYEQLHKQRQDADAALLNKPAPGSKGSDGTAPSGGGDNVVAAGGELKPGKVGSPNSGGSFDMSKLTKKDYDDLAFAISSEAYLGTDDELGVAANILTRLKSGKYGGSVSEIIHAKGQYEGVYKGYSKASPTISAKLQSPEGQKKIQDFITQLDGRTEFKGQSQLGNRVKAEDPMFSSGGNFYHYSWQ